MPEPFLLGVFPWLPGVLDMFGVRTRPADNLSVLTLARDGLQGFRPGVPSLED